MNYILPFLSIVFGFATVLIFKPKNQRNIKLLLAFSGAFLLAMTVFTLIPEVFHSLEHIHDEHCNHNHSSGKEIGVWIVVGILLQIVLEFFSRGAEHGHMHHPHSELKNAFPWSLFISLSIHSILEGFPLHHHHNMVYGIFIHHLPIAMVLTIFFLDSGIGFKKTFIFLILFALMTPFGTLLAEFIPQLGNYHIQISAIVIGIFLHISSVILFETSENHKFNHIKLGTIILGFVAAYFT
ncbi:ZIP family metal transporter [Capnocytophaga stomatis]|nr:ZIP family metal transporter [Capnocytophaga stomatis]